MRWLPGALHRTARLAGAAVTLPFRISRLDGRAGCWVHALLGACAAGVVTVHGTSWVRRALS